MENQVAYYVTEDGEQLISVDDAMVRYQAGVQLRDHLFDVGSWGQRLYLPLKFVPQSNKRKAYFARKKPSKKVRELKSIFSNDIFDWFENVKFDKIALGKFKLCSSYILDVTCQEKISFTDVESGDKIDIIPDITINTAFMCFFVEIWTDNEWDENIDLCYKKYRKYLKNSGMPFTVIRIDVRDLKEKAEKLGYASIAEDIVERLQFGSGYKVEIAPLTLYKDDAPFGWNDRSGLPFSLIVNPYPFGCKQDLRQLLGKLSDCITIKTLDMNGMYSLFLSDDSVDSPLYPLSCPIHRFHPLKILQQGQSGGAWSNHARVFLSCEQYQGSNGVEPSECDFTVTFCDKYGNLEDEYLVMGNLARLFLEPELVISTLNVLRECCSKYRKI